MSKKTRTSYNQVQQAVDAWNRDSKFELRQRGFLRLINDGNVYELAQVTKDGGSGVNSLGGTDGSLKSCLRRVAYLRPGAIEI